MAERNKGRSQGFTLLEAVAVLGIMTVAGVLAAGFFNQQVKLYYGFDRISRAEAMCGRAYRELERMLRYGYVFYADPGCPGRLSYYTREPEASKAAWEEGGVTYERLPPVSGWPHISAGDLDVDEAGGMTLELDFEGTESKEARVVIRIKEDEEVVYEQEASIRSMYDYRMEGE